MRSVYWAAWLCGFGLAAQASAAPLGGVTGGVAADAATAVMRVGDSCRRCRDCNDPHAYRYGYLASRYEPSVVYYGPSGIYRPYPPVVVYDYPVYVPRYSAWRYGPDYHYYRYYRRW